MQIYKEYCRLNKLSSKIAIDGTGSVADKFRREIGINSSHLFLYVIVTNLNNTTVAVNQMISELHTTEVIEFWLQKWIRDGAPKPREAVCDYSRALQLAIYLAFTTFL